MRHKFAGETISVSYTAVEINPKVKNLGLISKF